MDKKDIRNYQIFSIIFTYILGTILHFTYKLASQNKIIAIFSTVNESTWEHLKLIFFPMLITTIIGLFIVGRKNKKYFCAKVIGILTAMFLEILFFYTYNGILGENIALIDILSFFIAVALGEYISYKFINGLFPCKRIVSIIIIIVLILCFIIFTYNPPKIGLFKDPITDSYGINYK